VIYPGRNDPCHCGSGRKYKKCHLRADQAAGAARRHFVGGTRTQSEIPPQVLAKLKELEGKRRQSLELYGDVRGIVHGDFAGYKFVAVGATLHYSQHWKVFHDFLFYFIKHALTKVFGADWARGEMAKPPATRHPILRWYDALCQLQIRTQATQAIAEEGLWSAEVDGPTAAYLNLAYDLYILAHHGLLHSPVVMRLKERSTFRSARYEMAVAALMLRAGFSIKYENEADSKTTHPEFIATHKRLGDVVAVEAKSKWRKGVIEWKGATTPPADFRLRIGDLLRDALEKNIRMPYVIFIDANMPPEVALHDQERWILEMAAALPGVASGFTDMGVFQGVPFTALIITNTPHDYADPGQPDPQSIGFITVPQEPRYPFTHPKIALDIERAAKQYGNVPAEFPEP
jgi:hypothetical protein